MICASWSSRYLPFIVGALTALALTFAGTALAQDTYVPAPSYTEIKIPVPSAESVPGTVDERTAYFAEGKVQDLSQYIGIVYNFLISIVGLLASVMMIIGGFQYLTSAGDSGKISAAKSRMANAFIGMILALGAYTILQTINPALLQFKPLWKRFEPVKTELSFVPWCEDVASGTPAKAETSVSPAIPAIPARAVTLVGADRTCGSVGTFTSGNSKGYCIFRGSDCMRQDSGHLWKTCMQSFHTADEIGFEVTKDSNKKFGACTRCVDLNDSMARQLGYEGFTAGICKKWETLANFGDIVDKQAQRRNFFNTGGKSDNEIWYCRGAVDQPKCVEVDLNCPAIDSGGSAVRDVTYGEDYGAAGCTNLDVQNAYTLKDGGKSLSSDNLEDGSFTPHLYNICSENPCNFSPPKGCSPAKGIIYGGRALLESGQQAAFATEDCTAK